MRILGRNETIATKLRTNRGTVVESIQRIDHEVAMHRAHSCNGLGHSIDDVGDFSGKATPEGANAALARIGPDRRLGYASAGCGRR